MKNIKDFIWKEINQIQSEKENYDPVILAEHLITLSALYGNLTQHIADLEHQYQCVLKLAIDQDPEKPYSKIESLAKSGDEYYKLKQAQGMEKTLIETIRSIKKYIAIKQHEYETSSNL